MSLGYVDALNDDGIAAADIIIYKEIVKKIPQKSGCLKDGTAESFVGCIRTSLRKLLEKSTIKCKVPALDFTTYKNDSLEYCTNKDDALEGFFTNID